MEREYGIEVIAIPYRSFKHRIRITKRFIKNYKIQDLGGVLYMERRGKSERN